MNLVHVDQERNIKTVVEDSNKPHRLKKKVVLIKKKFKNQDPVSLFTGF